MNTEEWSESDVILEYPLYKLPHDMSSSKQQEILHP